MVTFSKVEELPAHAVPGGLMHRLIGDRLAVMWGKRGKGTATPRHAHPHEQIAWLVSGQLDCRIGDRPVERLEAGTTFLIPGGVEHELWYREDCEIVALPRHDLFPGGKHPKDL